MWLMLEVKLRHRVKAYRTADRWQFDILHVRGELAQHAEALTECSSMFLVECLGKECTRDTDAKPFRVRLESLQVIGNRFVAADWVRGVVAGNGLQNKCRICHRTAIGPTQAVDHSEDKPPLKLTRPCVGLRPTTPHHDAGIRIEPPESFPTDPKSSPADVAAADPLDDPPV